LVGASREIHDENEKTDICAMQRNAGATPTQAANRRERRGYLKIAEYWSKRAKNFDRKLKSDSDTIQRS
jgi:hypothetical protein